MRETKPGDSFSIFVVFCFGNPSREVSYGNNETCVSCKSELCEEQIYFHAFLTLLLK